MKIVLRLCIWTAATFATNELAALSDQYAEFGRGPARFVMTSEELATWTTVKTDVDAKDFIDHFWARREPAFHVLFDQAVAFADQTLTRGKRRGSLTDMGRVMVIMGPYSRAREYKGSPVASPSVNGPDVARYKGDTLQPPHQSSADIDNRTIGTSITRCWTYETQPTGLISGWGSVEICFGDRHSNGEWRALSNHDSLFELVNRSRLLPAVSQTPNPVSTPNH